MVQDALPYPGVGPRSDGLLKSRLASNQGALFNSANGTDP